MARREVIAVVADAPNDLFGKGWAELDPDLFDALGLDDGDMLMVKGARITYVLCRRGSDQDSGTRRIRLDKFSKVNAGVRSGDRVSISRVEKKEVRRVVLAPAIPLRNSPEMRRFLKNSLLGRPVTAGDIVAILLFSRILEATVVSVSGGHGVVGEGTKVEISRAADAEVKRLGVTYDDIGGMRETIDRIREVVELPLRFPDLFRHLGITPPKGVLLYGPPGTGKTLLAKAIASVSDAHFISVSGPEIVGKYYGESEKKLREIFEEAQAKAPSIIFIDEIDSIAPDRSKTTGDVERRIVAQLLALMDGLKGRGNVVVIGATNRPEILDPALRRPGRFDREFEIGVPDEEGRREILEIHTRYVPLGDDVDLAALAKMTPGFVGADLAALVREAAMAALRRALPGLNIDELDEVPIELLETLRVEWRDFMDALRVIQPSALRAIGTETPGIGWDDVGDMERIKSELRELVELPLREPERFRRLGIEPPRGILLYGPPGCGKTLIARALAGSAGVNFISVKGPELLSKWFGESEKAVREVFRKARAVAPAIVFIDEIDALCPARGRDVVGATDRVVSQVLTELDGIQPLRDIVVLAATNRPDLIDPALLRPGRLEKVMYVGPPDFAGRADILRTLTKDMPLAEDVDLDDVARRTELFSGADLAALVREAGLAALREGSDVVRMSHFEEALAKVGPSLTPELIERYVELGRGLIGATGMEYVS